MKTIRSFLLGILLLFSTVAYGKGLAAWEYSFIKALNYEAKAAYTLAVEELHKAEQADQHNLMVLRELAYCYGQQGDYEKAKAYYKKVLALHPKDENARQNLEELEKRDQ